MPPASGLRPTGVAIPADPQPSTQRLYSPVVKGFPNQVADLTKLETAILSLRELIASGANPKDDGIWGPELVRRQVAGTGHVERPIEAYLREQLLLPADRQSFRTTARGLRQMLRLMGLIDDSGPTVVLTQVGEQAATVAALPAADDAHRDFWRITVRNIVLDDNGISHPYQVLLRLVARKPGITRAKCALALEAHDDSEAELNRIADLSDLREADIIGQIGTTQRNWDNAKKILPSLAEQLGDVYKDRYSYEIAGAPGTGADVPPQRTPRARPRGARRVTPGTIARAGTADRFDERVPAEIDPAARAAAIASQAERLRRHNLIVQELATILADHATDLSEDPFDILASFQDHGSLFEIKTLDGTAIDERERVREALAQLLYYAAFLAVPIEGGEVRKVACFEGPISDGHRQWLNANDIGVMWRVDGAWVLDALAQTLVGNCFR